MLRCGKVRMRTAEEQLLDSPEPSVGRGQALRGNAPPPPPPQLPVSLKQLVATQNELIRLLVENDTRHGEGRQPHPQQQYMDSSLLHPIFHQRIKP
jgi:hypothetical protein